MPGILPGDYIMVDNKSMDQLAVAAGRKTKERDYWLRKLSGEWAKSHFPYDNKSLRREGELPGLVPLAFEIPQSVSAALLKLSTGSDVRLHIILTTVLNALFHRWLHTHGDSTDIILGTPVLKPDKKQKASLINTLLVLRTATLPAMTFKELLLETRKTVSEALENNNYPIEILAQQLNKPITDRADFPLFDMALLVENIQDRSFLDSANFNMVLTFRREDSLVKGCLEYNPLLYEAATAGRIVEHFTRLLQEVTANIDTPIEAINLLSPDEEEMVLNRFNDTAADYSGHTAQKGIHELFERQVQLTPDNIAVVDPLGGRRTLTYSQLDQKACQLARVLIKRGVTTGTVVGIMLERSVELIAGILGILKAGGIYLPMDPDYPENRINYMVADSGASLVVTRHHIWDGLQVETNRLDIDEVFQREGENLQSLPPVPNASQNAAYIIYTSGSTGKPKGVLVEHFSVVNLAYSQKAYFRIDQTDRVLQFSSICFDASVEQIYIALFSGATLVMVSKDILLNSEKFEAYVSREGVTHIHAVPSFLMGMRLEHPRHLRRVIAGGDVCPPSLAQRWLPYADFYNEYGPTETTVTSIQLNVEAFNETIPALPIGKPIGNTTVYLLDRDMRPVPWGAPGELYIGGHGVARGYLNRPQLTAQTFVVNPFADDSPYSSLLYKTGDLARWRNDGNLEFLGRIDLQVKIRGHRIELGEIENQLAQHPAVNEAVVIARSDDAEDLFLCAYFVPEEGESLPTVSHLRGHLAAIMPEYMVPSYFVSLEAMPLNPAGKVDRKNLPAPRALSATPSRRAT